jgi:hypothetical protein
LVLALQEDDVVKSPLSLENSRFEDVASL